MKDDGVFRVQLLLLPAQRAQMETTPPSVNKQRLLTLVLAGHFAMPP